MELLKDSSLVPYSSSYALKKLKLAKRHLERIWSRTHSFEDLKNLRCDTNYYHAAIIKAKRTYTSSLISSSSTNPRQLWKNVNILLHRCSLPALSSYDSLSLFCQSFVNFFSDKIHKFHTSLLTNRLFLPLLTFLLLLLLLTFN